MTSRTPLSLRRDLRAPVPPPRWPEGVSLLAFDPEQHAGSIHSLLSAAYAQGGGTIASFEPWWADLRGDAEYDPSLVFLAAPTPEMVVGAAQCWSSGFVKDLAVAAPWRRQGVGGALLLHAFAVFRARGALHIELKVEAGNGDALRLYRRNLMLPVPTSQP